MTYNGGAHRNIGESLVSPSHGESFNTQGTTPPVNLRRLCHIFVFLPHVPTLFGTPTAGGNVPCRRRTSRPFRCFPKILKIYTQTQVSYFYIFSILWHPEQGSRQPSRNPVVTPQQQAHLVQSSQGASLKNHVLQSFIFSQCTSP